MATAQHAHVAKLRKLWYSLRVAFSSFFALVSLVLGLTTVETDGLQLLPLLSLFPFFFDTIAVSALASTIQVYWKEKEAPKAKSGGLAKGAGEAKGKVTLLSSRGSQG